MKALPFVFIAISFIAGANISLASNSPKEIIEQSNLAAIYRIG